MSKSTKYEIVRNAQVIETRSEKAAAIKLATKPGDIVRTTSGTVVHSVPARRVMKADRFKPYTRVDGRDAELAPGVKLPKHYVIAYVRPRQGFAMVRHETDNGYLLIDLTSGETTPVDTCREAAQVVKELAAKKAKAKGTKKGHLTAVA